MANRQFSIGQRLVATSDFEQDSTTIEKGDRLTVVELDEDDHVLPIKVYSSENDEAVWLEKIYFRHLRNESGCSHGSSDIVSFAQVQPLSPNERMYREVGLKDENGRWTEQAAAVLMAKLLEKHAADILLPLAKDYVASLKAAK